VLLEFHEAIEALAEIDARKARGVELRFFGGLNKEEIPAELDLSRRTVEADRYIAREWLSRRLGGKL